MFETVRHILADQLGIDEETITPETDIMEDLGADSLDLAELITQLEDEFSFVATDDAMHSVKTVGDVVNFIESATK